jgi:hypothetical protein
MAKYFLIIIAYMTKMMMLIHPKKFKKYSKISSSGLGSWDPHMMAYHKQLKDFTTMYDEEAII